MSHNTSRSVRIKQEARSRPDVVWQDSDGKHAKKLTNQPQVDVLAGGSELARLIQQSDDHQAAMRKIVQ